MSCNPIIHPPRKTKKKWRVIVTWQEYAIVHWLVDKGRKGKQKRTPAVSDEDKGARKGKGRASRQHGRPAGDLLIWRHTIAWPALHATATRRRRWDHSLMTTTHARYGVMRKSKDSSHTQLEEPSHRKGQAAARLWASVSCVGPQPNRHKGWLGALHSYACMCVCMHICASVAHESSKGPCMACHMAWGEWWWLGMPTKTCN